MLPSVSKLTILDSETAILIHYEYIRFVHHTIYYFEEVNDSELCKSHVTRCDRSYSVMRGK